MNKKEKGLLSLLLIGVLGTVAGLGVFGAFSDTTENPDNNFSTGNVVISDNDANSAMYVVTNQSPGGTPVVRCIRVTYSGSLAANVRLYTTTTALQTDDLSPHVNLTIQPGTATGTFPNCGTFTPDGAPLFTGTLEQFADTRFDYASGLPDFPGSSTSWATGNSVDYQFTLQLSATAPDTVQGASTGLHSYTWEAQNQ